MGSSPPPDLRSQKSTRPGTRKEIIPMTPLIQLKKAAPIFVLALVCFALFPSAQGVVPPPDGGYPNFTTAEGQKTLFNLTTGVANTAVGWFSLFSDIRRQLQHRYRRGDAAFQYRRCNIRRLVRRRFYSTPPASTAQPLERPPF